MLFVTKIIIVNHSFCFLFSNKTWRFQAEVNKISERWASFTLFVFLCHLCHFEETFFKNGKRAERARLLNLLKPMSSIYANSIHTLALPKFPLTRESVYPKCHFVFWIYWKTKLKILFLDFDFISIRKMKFR